MSNLTLLMATRNQSVFLPAAVDSILQQTSGDWRLIICDDGSVDDTSGVLLQYDDKRISFVTHQEPVGYAETLHELVYRSSSNYIGIIDSDDALHPDAVSVVQQSWALHPEAAMIYTDYYICTSRLEPYRCGSNRGHPAGLPLLFDGRVGPFFTFSKEAYRQTGGYNSRYLYAEHEAIAYELEKFGDSLFIDQPLYYKRYHTESAVHSAQRKTARCFSLAFAISEMNHDCQRLTKSELTNRLTELIHSHQKRVAPRRHGWRYFYGFAETVSMQLKEKFPLYRRIRSLLRQSDSR